MNDPLISQYYTGQTANQLTGEPKNQPDQQTPNEHSSKEDMVPERLEIVFAISRGIRKGCSCILIESDRHKKQRGYFWAFVWGILYEN